MEMLLRKKQIKRKRRILRKDQIRNDFFNCLFGAIMLMSVTLIVIFALFILFLEMSF